MRARPLVVAFALALTSAWVQAQEFRTVNEAAVVLYDAPSTQSKKLYIVNQGYPLEVLVVVEGWVKVRDANGGLSWIEAKQLPPKGPRTVMVKAQTAQIRQNADDASAVVFQAQQYVILDVVESSGKGWLRVRHRDGSAGFVHVSQVWGA